MAEKKKYIKMDPILQKINKKFITLNDDEKKKVNPVLKFVIESIITKLKDVSPLFKNLFESVFYGGSFYDGLRVGKPEEFDIDLRLVLPKLCEPKLEVASEPGFLRCNLSGWDKLEKNFEEYQKYRELSDFKDKNLYLLQNKVLNWMQSIVTIALQQYPKNGNNFVMSYPAGSGDIQITVRKGGPAITLNIYYGALDLYMDVDLVASFKFTERMWPPSPFKPIPEQCKKTDFLIVPKSKETKFEVPNRLWRLSFQEQEREMMNDNVNFKPALRLMKKLRDTLNQGKISSYFLKTIFLTEVMNKKNDKEFWSSPLSFIFMHMLNQYYKCIEAQKIPYFWNNKNNLIKSIEHLTLENIKFSLKKQIDKIEKNYENNPMIIAQCILPLEETTILNGSSSNEPDPKIIYLPKDMKDIITNNHQPDSAQSMKPQMFDIVKQNQDLMIQNEELNLQIKNILIFFEKTIMTVKNDTKTILEKITAVEESINEIKEENKTLMNEFKEIKENQQHHRTPQEYSQVDINKKSTEIDDKVDDISSSTLSVDLSDSVADTNTDSTESRSKCEEKILQLEKMLHDIKLDNDKLKSGLRDFVINS